MWHGSPAGLDALESGAAVTDLLLLAGGALIGALLALLGAGGSILLLPLLVSGLSLPMREAVPLSLIVVPVSYTHLRAHET